MGYTFGAAAGEDDAHFGTVFLRLCRHAPQADEGGCEAEGVGAVAGMGEEDSEVAFGVVVADGEAAVGVGLPADGMGYLYVGQGLAGFGIDDTSSMVGISDILRLQRGGRKLKGETYGCKSNHKAILVCFCYSHFNFQLFHRCLSGRVCLAVVRAG